MRHAYSAEQVRRAEEPFLAAGVPLMARAAAGLAQEVRAELERAGRSEAGPHYGGGRGTASGAQPDGGGPHAPGRVLVLAGTGNNGADALFAAAELAAAGVDVVIVQTGSRVHEEALAAAVHAGAVAENADAGWTAGLARRSDVVVDGILGTGTGADPRLRGRARELVSAILPVLAETARPRVVAVDIPSGIDPTTGAVPDAVVLTADVTVTFGGLKAGLLLPPARSVAGEVRLIDIGLTDALDAMDPVLVLPA